MIPHREKGVDIVGTRAGRTYKSVPFSFVVEARELYSTLIFISLYRGCTCTALVGRAIWHMDPTVKTHG
jgi:hypothetical protein